MAATGVTFQKRQRLITQGGQARGCWLLCHGWVAVDVLLLGHGPLVVETLGPLQTVGWSWLRPQRTWQFGAVALTEVDAIHLDTDRILTLCQEDPAFGQSIALAMFDTVADRLRHASARLAEAHAPNPRARR